MVLEDVISPKKIEKHPWDLFLIGFFYAILGIIISYWIFPSESSLISVFFISFLCIPMIYRRIKYEEKKTFEDTENLRVFKDHKKLIRAFVFLFLGICSGMTLIYTLFPTDIVNSIFRVQLDQIRIINSPTGLFSSGSGILIEIFGNNIRVLMLCFLLSLIVGSGAVFILVWNTSVISAALGTFIRNVLGTEIGLFGVTASAGYASASLMSFLRYMVHGIPEVVGFFIGVFAGGVLSTAIIHHHYRSKAFKKILWDSLALLSLGVIVILIAALVEVYLTPVLI